MEAPKRSQRFEYIDGAGGQEIWLHTFDAALGEGPSITFGKAVSRRIAVVEYGEAWQIVERLNEAAINFDE